IAGVVLVLTGPDGKPVTDVNGKPVGPVTTGPDGRYSFDNLPVLPAGQSYTVTLDESASAGALKDLVPTKTGQGTPGTDSSTGSAKSGDLTTDGAKDDTLDFGFAPEPVVPPTKPIDLSTKAQKKIVAKVKANGSMAPVVLKDAVTIRGLQGKGDVVAKLYGPVAKRTSNMCTSANLVGTVRYSASNGTSRTPGVTVRKPGVYTWVVSVRGSNGQQASHKCGLKSESTKVQRAGYGPVKIETGVRKAGPAARLGAGASLSASTIGLKAGLRPVGISKGQMVIPSGANMIGWLKNSAEPGDVIGTTVVAAHVSDNHDRPMAFWKLKDLKKGKIVTITNGGKTFRYKVTARAKFSRDHGPGIPKRYFKTTGASRLVLVTCTDKVTYPGGSFHYTNNLVVTAKRVN
ncbi:sortase domain-bontaining protein, partial [Nocardioides daejeonensis]|uniref:sortase domain-containing protein n=1 Tax=Nocardioides daejeonensis TaxID=1046556 RepID=UPI0013A5572F